MSDTISRAKAIEALKNDMASLDHIIKGMSANDVRLDAYVSQRNQVNYDIYTINNLPPAPGTDLAEVGTDCISRQAAIETVMDCYDNAELFEVYEEKLRELPPAQPEPIRINLNEPIKVKLTDWGKEIYYHQYDKANQIAGREICKPKFPEEDENGYTEIQLWCFVELYGEHMGMTLPNVIEPLEIVYERRTG